MSVCSKPSALYLLFVALLPCCASDPDTRHGDDPMVQPGGPRGDRPDDENDDGTLGSPRRIDLMEQDADVRERMDGSLRRGGNLDAAVAAEAGPRDGGLPDGTIAQAERAQDSRAFTVNSVTLAFGPVRGSTVETDRWFGVIGNAGYRIEVPKRWNGMLVMYAHGYHGTGDTLSVKSPSIRRHLIEQGYAWAASSFSTNYYDVRAGLEDTNALALAFRRIAAQNGRTLAEPTKLYIIGHSLGGHVAAAAVERETSERARNKVRYHGAVPMCAAVGGTALVDYHAAYQTLVHALAERAITRWPLAEPEAMRSALAGSFFRRFPTETTELGESLRTITMNLSGGPRPLFEQGFVGASQVLLWGAIGGDGLLHGVLRGEVADTREFIYQLDGDPALSTPEQALNARVFRVIPDLDANTLREDGVRWLPPIDAAFEVPVVTLHTLGDVFVPFSMQQVYQQKARAAGTAALLAQRAIRGVAHCDFTIEEERQAFQAMTDWEQRGVVAAGDDVADLQNVASPSFGCRFTVNVFAGEDAPEVRSAREAAPACPVAQ